MAQYWLDEQTSVYVREINPAGEIPMLFCHGTGGNGCHWSYQLKAFKKDSRLRLLFPDLPGHGRSSGEPRESIASYREIICKLVERMQLPKFFLVGHSMGGAITLDYARLYPHHLYGMVLLGAAARVSISSEIINIFRRGEAFTGLTNLAYHHDSPPEMLKKCRQELMQVPPHVFAADFTACDRFDLTQALPEINIPAVVIAGSGDRMVPLEWGYHLYQKLPQAELKVVERAGHMMMLEQPEQVNRFILDHVSRISYYELTTPY